jgi:cell division protein ZapA
LPNVEISINGRAYTVACDPGQEDHLRELAGVVDSRVRQLAGPKGGIGETHALVLAGLMLADELGEAKAASAPAPEVDGDDLEEHELLVAAVEHLTDRISVIADRLERA